MISVDCKNLKGTVDVPMSKSLAHRYLICAFLFGDYEVIDFFEEKCQTLGQEVCDDVRVTIACLQKLYKYNRPVLNCKESGTTLRMLLPIVGALGRSASFILEGSLTKRPIKELTNELSLHGMSFNYEIGDNESVIIKTSGKLEEGGYRLPGNISSQYISGLLFAFVLIDGECNIEIKGALESASYVAMTEKVIRRYMEFKTDNAISREALEEDLLEPDWSSAAMWLSASKLLDGKLKISNLKEDSIQGDSCFIEILKKIYSKNKINEDAFDLRETNSNSKDIVINIKDCPDLAPAIALAALGQERTVRIIGASRLKLKESNRISAIANILRQLGVKVEEEKNSLSITGVGNSLLLGSNDVVDTCQDHRMVMLAALSSIKCDKPVKIMDTQSINKSYPNFFKEIEKLSK